MDAIKNAWGWVERHMRWYDFLFIGNSFLFLPLFISHGLFRYAVSHVAFLILYANYVHQRERDICLFLEKDASAALVRVLQEGKVPTFKDGTRKILLVCED
jgi:hypothetical protein